MTITINGNDIDFTLEDEKTIKDVLDELRNWLGGTGMLLGDVKIDNRKIELDDKNPFERPVEEVEQLSVEALSLQESRIRQLVTAKDFFTLLRDAAETDDGDALENLEPSYQDLKKILPGILGEKPNSFIVSGLEKTLRQERQKLTSNAASMLAILDDRLKEAADPVGEVKAASATLTRLAENFDEVAVNLQTGRDRRAMDAIAELCDILQKFVRCLSWGVGIADLDILLDEMNRMLSELERALIANDTVLIGDLLEYELKPRLMELPGRMKFDTALAQ